MNSEGKDEEGKVIAEQNTVRESERQNVTKTTVTVSHDQIEQIQDQFQQVKIMTEENLVKNDDKPTDLTSKGTKGHPLPSFDDLRPQDRVKASDVWASLNKPLLGKFYLCQTIGPAMDMGGISVSVTDPLRDYYDDDEEDEKVGGMKLVLHNYSSTLHSGISGLKVTFDEILPLGSFLVLKNPLMAEGSLMWTCENPAEVELVSWKRLQSKFPDLKWDPENPKKGVLFFQRQYFWSGIEGDEAAFAKLKRFGNVGFVEKRYSDAIRFYNMALDYCSEKREERAMIQSNKSAALLAIGCFNSALKSAEAALEVDPGNEKCVYRKTKALIGLKKYQEALNFLEIKFDQFTSLGKSKDCKKLLETVKFFSSRENLGPTESQLISLHMGNFEDDDKIPEFIGPLALVPQIQGKGRGLVATADIRPGQLLICTKAFSFYQTPQISDNATMPKLNIGNKPEADKLCKEEAVKVIANKLTFDPELSSEFYNLTAGPELGHLEPEDPTKARHLDLERIKEILRINSFGPDRVEDDNIGEFTGLWILPSFFNHSCSEYNVVWAVRGEWMTVTAISEIKKGEELTLPYKHPIAVYEERLNYFSSLGFTCTCKLCQLEANEPKSVKIERAKILKSLEELATKWGPREIKIALKGVEKLVSLRKEHVPLNFPLLSPQIVTLADTLFCDGHFDDAISVLEAMFDVASASVLWHEDGIYVATQLLGCHAMRRDKKLAKKWMATVKQLMMKFNASLELMRIKELGTAELLQSQFGIDFFRDE